MDLCPACNSRDLIHIMLAPAGRKMRFNTCRACEHKWWTDGEIAIEIGLKDVLAHVAGS